MLYFVMAATKFAGIDPNGDTLYISGWLETNSRFIHSWTDISKTFSYRTRRLIPITSISSYFI
ncbi:MAG: hypothetical protein IPG00_09595 [Saprospiraceae bacterium]|nr:hypothetical protein [Saprospiraceae bacterium]